MTFRSLNLKLFNIHSKKTSQFDYVYISQNKIMIVTNEIGTIVNTKLYKNFND